MLFSNHGLHCSAKYSVLKSFKCKIYNILNHCQSAIASIYIDISRNNTNTRAGPNSSKAKIIYHFKHIYNLKY